MSAAIFFDCTARKFEIKSTKQYAVAKGESDGEIKSKSRQRGIEG